jgi:hypothetical protein
MKTISLMSLTATWLLCVSGHAAAVCEPNHGNQMWGMGCNTDKDCCNGECFATTTPAIPNGYAGVCCGPRGESDTHGGICENNAGAPICDSTLATLVGISLVWTQCNAGTCCGAACDAVYAGTGWTNCCNPVSNACDTSYDCCNGASPGFTGALCKNYGGGVNLCCMPNQMFVLPMDWCTVTTEGTDCCDSALGDTCNDGECCRAHNAACNGANGEVNGGCCLILQQDCSNPTGPGTCCTEISSPPSGCITQSDCCAGGTCTELSGGKVCCITENAGTLCSASNECCKGACDSGACVCAPSGTNCGDLNAGSCCDSSEICSDAGTWQDMSKKCCHPPITKSDAGHAACVTSDDCCASSHSDPSPIPCSGNQDAGYRCCQTGSNRFNGNDLDCCAPSGVILDGRCDVGGNPPKCWLSSDCWDYGSHECINGECQ